MINKFNKGFTLVETLGAVVLLSIALVGPLTIANKALQAARISKDQNTAFNLAQDAIEYVRFVRDTNCLVAASGGCPDGANGAWLYGNGTASTISLAPCISTNGSTGCYFDSLPLNPSTPTACNSPTCSATSSPASALLNYDSTNNRFTYSTVSVDPTMFTRAVQIVYNPSCSAPCNADEADVIVTVFWSDPISHSITVKESLYDWQ